MYFIVGIFFMVASMFTGNVNFMIVAVLFIVADELQEIKRAIKGVSKN